MFASSSPVTGRRDDVIRRLHATWFFLLTTIATTTSPPGGGGGGSRSFLAAGVTDARVMATQMSQRVVVTQYGSLRGVLVTLPGAGLPQVEAYLGLEYASLLGGDLRFMPPTSPVTTWDGVRSALKFKPVCPQRRPNVDDADASSSSSSASSQRRGVEQADHLRRILPFVERQQEDCLFLNVYVPVTGKGTTGGRDASWDGGRLSVWLRPFVYSACVGY